MKYWATNYGREKFNNDIAQAKNKVERVSEIMKAMIENEDKNIGLYYRDRIDYEKTRDDLERAGLSDGFMLDETIAQMFAEIAAQQNIDDLQIISLEDPNIKEVVGADAIAGRAYHVGNGKVVIVAENLQDFADAMGTIAEEGRHIYHRNSNELEDSEDYASFYGKQFENYFNKRAKDTPLYMIGSNLAYNARQLGNDWEDDIWVAYNPLGINHVSIYNDRDDKFFSYGEPVPYAEEVYKQKRKIRWFTLGKAENDVLQISSLNSYLTDAKNNKQDVVMFRLNLSEKEISKIENRLKKVTKGFESFNCPTGKSGCNRKADYYLMVKKDLLPDVAQQYDVLRNNCAVFVKRMLFGDIGGSGINLIHGNLPSNIADWSYNRTSTLSDSFTKVTRSKEINYYDYNSTKQEKIIIDIKNKSVRDVYLEIQKLR